MNTRRELLLIAALALAFSFLFTYQRLGLNLLLFEAPLLCWIFIRQKERLTAGMQRILWLCTVLSLIATTVVHTGFSYIIHFMVLFMFIGSISSTSIRTPLIGFANSIWHFFLAVQLYIDTRRNQSRRFKVFNLISKLRFFFIPFIILLIFLGLYNDSNPLFASLSNSFLNNVGHVFKEIFLHLNFFYILFFIIGIWVSAFFLLRPDNAYISDEGNDNLRRRKLRKLLPNLHSSIRNELKSSLILFATLNLILALVNITDVYYVWFQFEWSGSYLKDFVHDGTHKLIISIIFSIAVLLYYFRNNLNFYSGNRWHLRLAYLFLVQNAILCASLFIRNNLYVKYFSLAYGRIGVYVFLILTLIGLATVFYKLRHKKSLYFLLRINSIATVLLLTICSLCPWDIVIARYNFAHYHDSFLHLDFLSHLSDSALPYLECDPALLESAIMDQEERYLFREAFMSPAVYTSYIQLRKKEFLEKYSRSDWREWNYAEWQTWEQLRVEN